MISFGSPVTAGEAGIRGKTFGSYVRRHVGHGRRDMAGYGLLDCSGRIPDKQYGVDWVNIGYKPGGEVFLQKMLSSIRAGSRRRRPLRSK